MLEDLSSDGPATQRSALRSSQFASNSASIQANIMVKLLSFAIACLAALCSRTCLAEGAAGGAVAYDIIIATSPSSVSSNKYFDSIELSVSFLLSLSCVYPSAVHANSQTVPLRMCMHVFDLVDVCMHAMHGLGRCVRMVSTNTYGMLLIISECCVSAPDVVDSQACRGAWHGML